MDICKQVYGESQAYFDGKTCGYTAQEIAHQPAMWRALCEVLRSNRQAIDNFMASVGPLRDMRVIMTGAGSSGFTGKAVAGFVTHNSGILCEAVHTTDIVSAPESVLAADKPTMLISFARSGNSPESDGAVRYARKIVKNLYEVAIVCDGTSKLSKTTRESDKSLVLVMPEGTNDKGFAMTSSVSTMAMAGFALFNANKTDEIVADYLRLADVVEAGAPAMAKDAKLCAGWGFERLWCLASGPLTALASEGALKMMELTNGAVLAGHNNSAEFRHGPKTMLNPKTLTLHFVSNVPFTAQYDLDLLNQLYHEREGNKVVALHNKAEKVQADLAIPYSVHGFGFAADICAGMQGLVFMQMLSMFMSLALGITTDNPSPSGLVNRVVQGVTVYDYVI